MAEALRWTGNKKAQTNVCARVILAKRSVGQPISIVA
jgi:hypothetical protein